MSLVARIRSLFRRRQANAEVEEELRAHIENRVEDLERFGVSRSEAERRARIEFGSRARFQEECHEEQRGNFIETLMMDIRFSLRLLRKSPAFTIAAVLTLALAIAANAVVFGVLNALVIKPLNVPQSESLYGTQYGDNSGFQSYPNYLDLRAGNRSFYDLAAFSFAFVGLDQGGDPTLASGFMTSGNYFDVLRIQPYLGRFFHNSDEHGPNSAPYLVLSYPYWQSHFHGDHTVQGRVVQINRHPFTIVGVAPPEFGGTLLFVTPDFFLPIVDQPQVDGENHLEARAITNGVFEAFGHLKPGVTLTQANADVNAIGARLEKSYPKDVSHKRSNLAHEGLTSFGGAVRAFVSGLMLLAGLILLAACANLGSLFSARAADRSREMALRLALGSSRSRIVRGLLTEATLISIVGGSLGLLGSVGLLRWLSTWRPFSGNMVHVPIALDASVYIMALVLALASGFLFGVTPIRQVLNTNPYGVVKGGSSTKAGRRLTLRDFLLVAQIAICALLVTSSLVALRGFMRSLKSNVGISTRNAILVNTNLTMAGYRKDQFREMQKRIIAGLESIPNVTAVGLVNNHPPLVDAAAVKSNVFRDGTAERRKAQAVATPFEYDVSPGYFSAAATALQAGRVFTWHDDASAPAVAVVNREFAGLMFGGGNSALGQFFELEDGTRVQVVGIVQDGKYKLLTEEHQPAIFLPFLRSPVSATSIIIRSTLDTQILTEAIRNSLRAVDSGMPFSSATWDTQLAVVLFPARIATLALGVLGVLGATLSVAGIFGMAAYSVSTRLKELGIRMAIGAERADVLKAALGRSIGLLAFGSAAGPLLGILASKVLASIVYQATPRDPLVLAGVVLVMASIGIVAAWLPAQRALSLDPLSLLREE